MGITSHFVVVKWFALLADAYIGAGSLSVAIDEAIGAHQNDFDILGGFRTFASTTGKEPTLSRSLSFEQRILYYRVAVVGLFAISASNLLSLSVGDLQYASSSQSAWLVVLRSLCANPQGNRKLGRVFETHIREAEAPGGSLQEILASKPPLERLVKRILDEHLKLREEITLFESEVSLQVSSGEIDIESLRQRAGRLDDAVRLHQARGADLVFEAFLFEAFYRVDGGQG